LVTSIEAADKAVLDAIVNRRSPAKFSTDRPPRAAVEQLLAAAIRAPNHYRNEPWRFFVLAGVARERFADALVTRLVKTLPDPTTPQAQSLIDRERQKPFRAPVIIAVAAVQTSNTKAMPLEDVEATAAAVENVLLAAPAVGLGAFWRTGEPAYDSDVKAFFGLRREDQLVGFLYVGYPEVMGDLTPRTGIEDKTQWLGWDD
jgi:nitroreductase